MFYVVFCIVLSVVYYLNVSFSRLMTSFGPGRALRERLRTNSVFTIDQSFYLNYHKFSIKSYVLDVY